MIFFLHGADTYRSRKKLSEFKDKYIREIDPSGNSLVVLNGETMNLAQFNEAVSPSSLFVRRRMVVVENFFHSKKEMSPAFLEILKKNRGSGQHDNILIFWDEIANLEKDVTKGKKAILELLKKQTVQEFELLSNTKVAAWIKSETEIRGGKISLRAANALAGMIGSDLWQISNEIDKLINYKQAKVNRLLDKSASVVIEPEDVEEIVSGQFEENIFALTDAISHKNKSLAIKLLEEQLRSGADEQWLLSMIVRQFRILLQIRTALDASLTPRQITTQLKLHPFVVQKGINQVRSFSTAFLKKAFSQLAKIDYSLKTGRGNLRTMVDLLIVKL